MNTFFKDSVVPLLKKLWWLWLAIVVVAGTIWLFGPKNVSLFFERTMQVLFTIGLLAMAYFHTIGRANSGVWKVIRVMGMVGTLMFSVGFLVNGGNILEIWDLAATDEKIILNRKFALAATVSIFILGMGELILYLHKINHKLKLHSTKEMICPACYGKGYIDRADLKRLDAHRDVLPGACGYCHANGHVDRRYTLKVDLKLFLSDLLSIQRYGKAKEKIIQDTVDEYEAL